MCFWDGDDFFAVGNDFFEDEEFKLGEMWEEEAADLFGVIGDNWDLEESGGSLPPVEDNKKVAVGLLYSIGWEDKLFSSSDDLICFFFTFFTGGWDTGSLEFTE